MAGLASAKAQGRQGGRRRAMDQQTVKLTSRLMKANSNGSAQLSVAAVCAAVGVSSARL